jgi:hypothetical protein
LRLPPPPLRPWLLERVDDADAVEIIEARQVFGIERLDAGFDTCSENEGVPEGGSSGEMELFGASQVPSLERRGVGDPEISPRRFQASR